MTDEFHGYATGSGIPCKVFIMENGITYTQEQWAMKLLHDRLDQMQEQLNRIEALLTDKRTLSK